MALFGLTTNYKFKLIDFDIATWHDDEYDNWRSVDAVLNSFFGTTGFTGVWANSTAYSVNQIAVDAVDGKTYECLIAHTSAATPTLFSTDRTSNPTFWAVWLLSHAGDTNNPHLTPMVHNRIINGNFNIWQRGTNFTASEYTADRWFYEEGDGAVTVTRAAFTLGQTDVPEEPEFYIRQNQTGGSTTVPSLTQRVEGVRTFAGQAVTLSFWAKVATGTLTVTPRFAQNFGTSGGPSST